MARLQTTLDLMGVESRASEALVGAGQAAYQWPGSALSASTRALWFNLGLGAIVFARWLLVWTPQEPTAGVRLVSCASGPRDLRVMAEQTGSDRSTPLTAAVDVTASLRALQDGGEMAFIGHQLCGRPTVFSSTLELVWEV